jgi:hypothetical protein
LSMMLSQTPADTMHWAFELEAFNEAIIIAAQVKILFMGTLFLDYKCGFLGMVD